MSTAINKQAIFLIVIGFTAFGSCNGFYRPMPRFIENTLNKILNDQLARRFNLPAATTATPAYEVEQLEQIIKVQAE